MIIQIALVSFLIAIDQLTKLFIQYRLNEDIIINDWLTITYVKNYGVSFSMLEGRNLIIAAVTILAIVLIFILLKYYKNNKIYVYPLLLMLAGTIGNLIDRVYLGYVVDFISVRDFPIFNMADIYLTMGAFFLIIVLVKEEVDKWK